MRQDERGSARRARWRILPDAPLWSISIKMDEASGGVMYRGILNWGLRWGVLDTLFIDLSEYSSFGLG